MDLGKIYYETKEEYNNCKLFVPERSVIVSYHYAL